ncbi:MAG: type VI secretion system membrane subunit TssM [Gammaproteobacteria bacterium]|nr:type VI secretion system membrane subunit TssM [Gammaproteobacteria bacterium]
MKKILRFFLKPWVLTALGLLAIALIIWFIGPLIAIADYHPLESTRNRWLLILVIALFVVIRRAWPHIKAKTANKKLFESLIQQAQPTPQPAAGADEVATLQTRFHDALGVLKQAKFDDEGESRPLWQRLSGRYLYELPWYIFIGAPGSGKTTSLLNSGLKFPLANRFGEAAIRGVGGTRNCDWWFTDEAVLIDTAGRYTTHESNQEVDGAAWYGFLQLLKKYRPRRPINGVFLTISVADLLTQSTSQREAHADALRKRIRELHERLGIRFPIYVQITKVDRLPGFMEFFANMGSDERAQVWGTSFPLAKNGTEIAGLPDLSQEFAALETRLNERLTDRLQEERDPQRRALLYSLPQQFAHLSGLLREFIDNVFTPSRFDEPSLLRGIYFTSGTQEGGPIDRIMGSLGRAFGLENALLPSLTPTGKSFFITRLIRDIILPEAELAGTNLRWLHHRNLLRTAGLALIGVVSIGCILGWTVSYARNKIYVGEVQTNVDRVAAQVQRLGFNNDSADIISLLPELQAVEWLADAANTVAADVPMSMGFGLYQGVKLGTAADNVYQRALHATLLPRLQQRLEEQLRTQQDHPELLHETLKAYITLLDAERFDADALRSYVRFDWAQSLPAAVTPEQRQALTAHLDALLAHGPITSSFPADEKLVADTRRTLVRMPLAQYAYYRLKRLDVGADLPEFTIASAAGPSAALVFTRASGAALARGVPGLYSYRGYHDAFSPQVEQITEQLADEETWVIGAPDREHSRLQNRQAKENLILEVRRLYLNDYANLWDSFINDLRIVLGTRQGEAIQAVRLLSAPDSPLPELLRKMVHEVTLIKKSEVEKTLLDKGQDLLRGNAAKLAALANGGDKESTLEQLSLPEHIVDDRFENLRQMVTPVSAGQPARIDAVIALLKDMYIQMQAAELALRTGNVPPPDTVSSRVRAEAGQMPEPLRGALLTLSSTAADEELVRVKGNLSDQLAATIGRFCSNAMSGRYPLVKDSRSDITQDDFAHLFAPNGLLDSFFQKNLAQLVDTSTKPWSYRHTGARSGGGTETLRQFQRAQTIRDVFFRNGGQTPAMRLEFKPIEMDASITQFLLDVDGQIVRYRHGPQVAQPVQWPGPRGSSQVRVEMSPPSTHAAFGPFDGPWALFRMFDQVQIEPTEQPEKFRITFNIGGRKARFEVITSSVQNPFRLADLKQFQCPAKL